MPKFKVSVSDWELFFEDGNSIKIVNLISEKLTYKCDGKICIYLRNASFLNSLVDNIKKGIKIIKIKQIFTLSDTTEVNKIEKCEYEYDNLYIKDITIVGKSDEVSTFNITLKN